MSHTTLDTQDLIEFLDKMQIIVYPLPAIGQLQIVATGNPDMPSIKILHIKAGAYDLSL